MARASIIIYIAVVILLLLLLSFDNNKPHGNRPHRSRRLKIRSNFTFTSPADPQHYREHMSFDPLVADIERKREDRHWEKRYTHNQHPQLDHEGTQSQSMSAPGHEAQPEWDDFMDAEDYLNDDDRFNVTSRLVQLFPHIDVDPADGVVSEDELTRWYIQQNQKDELHRTAREMEKQDNNKDGFVSFAEFDPPSWFTSDNNSVGYNMGWWKVDHYNASDDDGDGLLNITEFNYFLHPADTNSPKLLRWLCQEEIRERDRNKDGKINFNEFFHGLFDLLRNYDEDSHNSSYDLDDLFEGPARLLFAQLDKNGDGYLTDVELLPIIDKLHPSERYYAKQQSHYIMQQADANSDGFMSLAEMIDSPYVFYNVVFNEDDANDIDYYYNKQELR